MTPPTTEERAGGEKWGNGALGLNFGISPESHVRLLSLNGSAESRAALPLGEVEVTGHGRVGTSDKRHVDSAAGARLRYEHHVAEAGHLTVHLHGPETDLRVSVHYLLMGKLPVVRCWSEVTAGSRQARIENVSSFVLGGVASLPGDRIRWQHRLQVAAPSP